MFSLAEAFLDLKSHQNDLQNGAKIKEKTISSTISKKHQNNIDFGAKMAPQMDPKININQHKFGQEGHRASKGVPRGAQDTSKTPFWMIV